MLEDLLRDVVGLPLVRSVIVHSSGFSVVEVAIVVTIILIPSSAFSEDFLVHGSELSILSAIEPSLEELSGAGAFWEVEGSSDLSLEDWSESRVLFFGWLPVNEVGSDGFQDS